MDDAFNLSKNAYNEASHEKARDQLQKKYPNEKEEIIVEAYSKARDLEHACYDFGDKCRLKLITDLQALKSMEKKFPGFSKGTYKSALGYGYHISR